jgi:hypothetical protein
VEIVRRRFLAQVKITRQEKTLRAVVQRVTRAEVRVEGKITGKISAGLVVLLGIGREDTAETAAYLAGKIANLRIFRDLVTETAGDKSGKMNRSLLDIAGSALVVSQFTLYGILAGAEDRLILRRRRLSSPTPCTGNSWSSCGRWECRLKPGFSRPTWKLNW